MALASSYQIEHTCGPAISYLVSDRKLEGGRDRALPSSYQPSDLAHAVQLLAGSYQLAERKLEGGRDRTQQLAAGLRIANSNAGEIGRTAPAISYRVTGEIEHTGSLAASKANS